MPKDPEQEKAPAYQWYPKDYEMDEPVKFMTYEQEGIYRRLLDHQWLHGGIPSDLDQVSMLVPKIPRARFRTVWPGIAVKFDMICGRLVNPRMERQRKSLEDHKRRQGENGKKGAESRWGKAS